MPEPLRLAALRREQRRVAALLDAPKQLGVALPSRQDIPYEDLYKSEYYLRVQAGFKQTYFPGTQPTAVSLPEMVHWMKTEGNNAGDATILHDVRKPTAAISLVSTQEGWKQLKEVKEKRERLSKRNKMRIAKNAGNKRVYEASEGVAGWSPNQGTREMWTRKKIRGDSQTAELIGQKLVETSGFGSLSGMKLANHAGSVDYRLPNSIPKFPSMVTDPGGANVSSADVYHPSLSPRQSSVTGKPLLRYNHGEKGLGMDLSQRCHPDNSGRGGGSEITYDWSVYSDSPDDAYRPFYPSTPSSSPASFGSVDGFDLTGWDPESNSNIQFNEQNDPDTTGVEGCWDDQDPSNNQSKHVRWDGDAESGRDGANASMKHFRDERVPPYSILRSSTDHTRLSRAGSKGTGTSLETYRDAYVRALAVARSRCLPNDFTALGTRTSRAFSFSYFSQHGPTCKCQTCLERVHRDSPTKKRAKRKKQPQGLKLILGDVKIEDYYK